MRETQHEVLNIAVSLGPGKYSEDLTQTVKHVLNLGRAFDKVVTPVN